MGVKLGQTGIGISRDSLEDAALDYECTVRETLRGDFFK
jgi:hypothetical protein